MLELDGTASLSHLAQDLQCLLVRCGAASRPFVTHCLRSRFSTCATSQSLCHFILADTFLQ
jgi:hypothetical protein